MRSPAGTESLRGQRSFKISRFGEVGRSKTGGPVDKPAFVGVET
jgi:hypothetical protein